VVIGKDLMEELGSLKRSVKVKVPGNPKVHELLRLGTVDAKGPAVALAATS